jgi:hypothetical protein
MKFTVSGLVLAALSSAASAINLCTGAHCQIDGAHPPPPAEFSNELPPVPRDLQFAQQTV